MAILETRGQLCRKEPILGVGILVKNGLDMNVMNAVLDSGKTHWAKTNSSFHDSLEY